MIVAVDTSEPVPKRAKRAPKAAVPSPAKPAKAAHGPTRAHEKTFWDKGFTRVAGVDEAGRGPLAGPVVAAACVLPQHVTVAGVNDSKQLSAEEREELYEEITSHPDIIWAV